MSGGSMNYLYSRIEYDATFRTDTPERRAVTLGQDNGRVVLVQEGLKPGEKVMLAPPLAAGEVTSSAASPPSPAAKQQ